MCKYPIHLQRIELRVLADTPISKPSKLYATYPHGAPPYSLLFLPQASLVVKLPLVWREVLSVQDPEVDFGAAR